MRCFLVVFIGPCATPPPYEFLPARSRRLVRAPAASAGPPPRPRRSPRGSRVRDVSESRSVERGDPPPRRRSTKAPHHTASSSACGDGQPRSGSARPPNPSAGRTRPSGAESPRTGLQGGSEMDRGERAGGVRRGGGWGGGRGWGINTSPPLPPITCRGGVRRCRVTVSVRVKS